LDFQISQGSAATHLRWDGSLCNLSVENLPRNLTVKELTKKTKWLFWNTVYFATCYLSVVPILP